MTGGSVLLQLCALIPSKCYFDGATPFGALVQPANLVGPNAPLVFFHFSLAAQFVGGQRFTAGSAGGVPQPTASFGALQVYGHHHFEHLLEGLEEVWRRQKDLQLVSPLARTSRNRRSLPSFSRHCYQLVLGS